jgi:hypothetical protein
MRAVVGFAPHSGWTAAVVVTADVREPRVLHRGRIELAEDALQGSRQPYHWVEGRSLPHAERELSRFLARAKAKAYEGVQSLVAEAVRQGHELTTAGILASSGRKGGSLDAILKSHALIHTADGDHFRDALEDACVRSHLGVVRVPLRELDRLAAKALGLTGEAIQGRVKELGRSVGSPWTRDEKTSCLLGWYLLTT